MNDLLPGTHSIRPHEISPRNWREFIASIRKLRIEFPAVATKKEFLEQDIESSGIKQPALYELVFRGQASEYVDQRSGKPLLIPSALRQGVCPTFVDRIPVDWWYEIHHRLIMGALSSSSPHKNVDTKLLEQCDAFGKALVSYGFALLGLNRETLGFSPAELVERSHRIHDCLDRLALHSHVKTKHSCIFWEWPFSIPPLGLVLKDLACFHTLKDIGMPVWASPNFTESPFLNDLITQYAGYFIYINLLTKVPALGILQHYGIQTKCLDVTLDPIIALWFALHRARLTGEKVKYAAWPETGYLYVFWVPVTFLWTEQRLDYYKRAKRRGYGLHRLLNFLEPNLFVDISSNITFIEHDRCTRAFRQKAAMLTGLAFHADWPATAYSEYLVARITVNRGLLSEAKPQGLFSNLTTDYLFPPSTSDRLLGALISAGLKGVQQYV